MKQFYEYGGRNDLETIRKVAEEMKIPQEDATELIEYALLNTLCTGMNRQLGSADGEAEESRQEMLAAHLGFCPDCFGVLERTGHSEKWYDCVPRKKLPYEGIAISHSLSSPESAGEFATRPWKRCETSILQHSRTASLSNCRFPVDKDYKNDYNDKQSEKRKEDRPCLTAN